MGTIMLVTVLCKVQTIVWDKLTSLIVVVVIIILLIVNSVQNMVAQKHEILALLMCLCFSANDKFQSHLFCYVTYYPIKVNTVNDDAESNPNLAFANTPRSDLNRTCIIFSFWIEWFDWRSTTRCRDCDGYIDKKFWYLELVFTRKIENLFSKFKMIVTFFERNSPNLLCQLDCTYRKHLMRLKHLWNLLYLTS